MAAAGREFKVWLRDKLNELKTDENVFSSYIIGILEGDESNEEKTEALEEVLSEIIENDLSNIVSEILEKWKSYKPSQIPEVKEKPFEDVEGRLAKMLEAHSIQTIEQKHYTADELKIREQILSQYSQTAISDDEDICTEKDDPQKSGLIKNTNAHDVQQALKERREQAKLDSQKKKEKDKEDREKQKQLREEKKEKRKTVKGERRR